MKKNVWKGIIIFVAFMVAFTIVSRIVSQITTPNIQVTYPAMDSISKQVVEDGYVQGSQEVPVFTEPGIRISQVHVKVGSYVKEGDILFTYDVKHLQDQQKDLKDQIYILDLQIADEQALLQAMPESSTTNLKQLNLSRKKLVSEKSVLDKLIKNAGNVVAELGGQISRVSLEVGSETTGTAEIMIADDTQGKHVQVMVAEEYRQYLTIGQTVMVDYTTNFYGEAVQTTGDGILVAIEIDELTGMLNLIVDLSELEVNIGDYVSVHAVDVSMDYSSVIPREALRFGTNGYFVYVIEETETIMGTETRIYQQNVKVLDSNDSSAAVEGVSAIDPIVVDSDRQLTEGGRVRFAE